MTAPTCQQCAHFSVPLSQPPCDECRHHARRPAFVPAGPRAVAPPDAKAPPLAPGMGNWRIQDAQPHGRVREDADGVAVGRIMRT